MSGSLQLGLKANLPRVQAQRRIFLGNFKATDFDAVYELFLTAHGDRKIAEDAQLESMQLYVDEQCNRAVGVE